MLADLAIDINAVFLRIASLKKVRFGVKVNIFKGVLMPLIRLIKICIKVAETAFITVFRLSEIEGSWVALIIYTVLREGVYFAVACGISLHRIFRMLSAAFFSASESLSL